MKNQARIETMKLRASRNKSTRSVQLIKSMRAFDIEQLNRIARRIGISLALAVFYFNATH